MESRLATPFSDKTLIVSPLLGDSFLIHPLLKQCEQLCIIYYYRPFDPDEPSSASMSEMRQELRDVKSEILELKQLMRTSFDMQLEIQRAIRQEVAAALSSACIPLSTLSQPSIPSGGYILEP